MSTAKSEVGVPSQIDTQANTRPLQERFHHLASEWEEATGFFSSMEAASKHPAYEQIVNMGQQVIPLLLGDMERNHTHWFIALERITGAHPVSPADAGNIPKMVQRWLDWAKANGYAW